jgi:hypothetical protein
MFARYGVEGVSTFWVDEATLGGVQLDLADDPGGRGVYGFRSDHLVARAVDGDRWPRLMDGDQAAYLAAKRSVKNDVPRLTAAIEVLRSAQQSPLEIRELFSEPMASRLDAMVSSGHPVTRGANRRRARDASRLVRRMRHPTAVWVHVEGSTTEAEELARGLVARFTGLFPVCICRPVVSSSSRYTTPAFAAARRHRAALTVTFGAPPHGTPDVVLDASAYDSPAEARTAAVSAMAVVADARRRRGWLA